MLAVVSDARVVSLTHCAASWAVESVVRFPRVTDELAGIAIPPCDVSPSSAKVTEEDDAICTATAAARDIGANVVEELAWTSTVPCEASPSDARTALAVV